MQLNDYQILNCTSQFIGFGETCISYEHYRVMGCPECRSLPITFEFLCNTSQNLLPPTRTMLSTIKLRSSSCSAHIDMVKSLRVWQDHVRRRKEKLEPEQHMRNNNQCYYYFMLLATFYVIQCAVFETIYNFTYILRNSNDYSICAVDYQSGHFFLLSVCSLYLIYLINY